MKTTSGREAKAATEPSECRSCHAEILWVRWERSGKRMPVDSVPDMRPMPKGGDIVLTLRGGEFGELIAEKHQAQKHGEQRNRYASHFAKCPNAKEHRKDK